MVFIKTAVSKSSVAVFKTQAQNLVYQVRQDFSEANLNEVLN